MSDDPGFGAGFNELIVADLVREDGDPGGTADGDAGHLMALVTRQKAGSGRDAFDETKSTVSFEDGVFMAHLHKGDGTRVNWQETYKVIRADVAKGAENSTILSNLSADVLTHLATLDDRNKAQPT